MNRLNIWTLREECFSLLVAGWLTEVGANLWQKLMTHFFELYRPELDSGAEQAAGERRPCWR
jgi:hypothetical protein